MIVDPFVENNEEKEQWVTSKKWEYKTSFTLSDRILNKEKISINFNGIGMYVAIYINKNSIVRKVS